MDWLLSCFQLLTITPLQYISSSLLPWVCLQRNAWWSHSVSKEQKPIQTARTPRLWCGRGTCLHHLTIAKHLWHLKVDIFSHVPWPFVFLARISSVCGLGPFFSMSLTFFIHFWVLYNSLLSVMCVYTHTHFNQWLFTFLVICSAIRSLVIFHGQFWLCFHVLFGASCHT